MARGKAPVEDNKTLEMALVGYEIERQKIEERIREIRGALGGAAKRAIVETSGPTRRKMSAAARRRIAAAQKKRWAEHRKNQAAQSK